MSDLRINTILGTVLASALVVMGLRIGGEAVFATHEQEKPGMDIDISAFAAGASGAGAAPAVEQGPLDWGRLLADPALVEAGQKAATKCASCHNFVSGGPNMTGPNLYGVVGRVSGAQPGFTYSAAMKEHALAWTYDELSAFLTAPQKHVKGTIMTFVGLKKQDERVAMIAYLRSLAAAPAPLPAPLPEAPVAPAPDAAPVDGVAAPAAPH